MAMNFAQVPFLNAGPINAAFAGTSIPKCLALRNVEIDWMRPGQVATAAHLNVLAFYISLDTTYATSVTAFGYELAYRFFQESAGPLMDANQYLNQAQARDHVRDVIRNILRGGHSRTGRTLSIGFVEEIRNLYVLIHGLLDADRTYEDFAGADVLTVFTAPAANVADWAAWGGAFTAEMAVAFLVLAAGGPSLRCAARHVEWIKAGMVYIWYTLMFAGTSNAKKFDKFVRQCGMNTLECPWPADVGVLAAMNNKMTGQLDREGYAQLFTHMGGQNALEILGLRNMVAQGRYHGMTSLMMILGAMKECPHFQWNAVRAMWPTECTAFNDVLLQLEDAVTHIINPWGGFGTMAEKNAVKATKFKCLAQLAFDIQKRFMGNTTIENLASFGGRAVYGKWSNIVDQLMTNYETWVTANLTLNVFIAAAPATAQAQLDVVNRVLIQQ